MTWPRRPAFVAAPLEQAFWIASLAVSADATKRDRVIAAVLEMCETVRARGKA